MEQPCVSCFFKWIEGQTLGDTFRLQERLGRGTYGVVGKAVRLKDGPVAKQGQIVALKVPFDQELGPDTLRQEPDTIAQFNHPNIVKVFGCHTIAGYFVIEMELVEGHSLAQILDSNGDVPRRQLGVVLGWVRQCALALDAMGDFAHGDIKPQNILIGRSGQVKLVDFGTSRRMEDVWVFTSGQGTEQYMAPEVALDSKRVSVRSDLYSLGVVLYELTTGEIPFHSNLERLQGKRLRKPRELNPALPEAVEHIILRCLERDPTVRFSSWLEFIHRLDAALKGADADPGGQLPAAHVRRESSPNPSSPLRHLDEAKRAILEERFSDAVDFAEKAVEASEGHPTYLRMLAAVATRAGYLQKAKLALSQLLARYDDGYPVEPDEIAHVIRKLADAATEMREYEEAVRLLLRLVSISPEGAFLPRFRLAVAYGLNGQYPQAIRLLEELRSSRPELPLVCSKLGWAHSLNGDYRQAVSYYNQTLVIDPYDLFSLFELGKYYLITGDERRATKYFDLLAGADLAGEYEGKVQALNGA